MRRNRGKNMTVTVVLNKDWSCAISKVCLLFLPLLLPLSWVPVCRATRYYIFVRGFATTRVVAGDGRTSWLMRTRESGMKYPGLASYPIPSFAIMGGTIGKEGKTVCPSCVALLLHRVENPEAGQPARRTDILDQDRGFVLLRCTVLPALRC